MSIDGDSWFDYSQPLSTDIPTESKRAFGDKIVQLDKSKIRDDARGLPCGELYGVLFDIMARRKLTFDCILFSGGGNDIVASNLPVLLNACQPGFGW